MRISIIKKEKINCIILPDKIMGNYWISDYDENDTKRNLINIEAQDNSWVLVNNDEYFCDEISFKAIPPVNNPKIEQYEFYRLNNIANTLQYLFYVSPIKEKFEQLINLENYKSIPCVIGSGNNCDIVFPILDKVHAIIKNSDNSFYITPESNSNVYVNDVRVYKEKKLEYGDIIFILGLKIIFEMYNNKFYLLVNNPKNSIIIKIPENINVLEKQVQKYVEPAEEMNLQLYKEDDYFHKSPRFIYELKNVEIEIDPPPKSQQQQNSGFLLTFGPMITMSLYSVIRIYSVISSILEKKTTWKAAMPNLVLCGVMMCSSLLWPLISKSIQKRNLKKYEKMRQIKYTAYIQKQDEIISEHIKEQVIILNNIFPSLQECNQIVCNKMIKLWEKKPLDMDFISVSLGYGTIPSQIKIKFPEEHFEMEEDNLKNLLYSLKSKPKNLVNVPLALSFKKNNIFGIVGNEIDIHNYFNQILLQLITFQSYNDLKFVLFTNTDLSCYWDYMKVLPHCWSSDKSIRFFGTKSEEYREICYNLERIYNNRKENSKNEDNLVFDETYIIIIDDFKQIRNQEFINHILDSKINYGFSVIILDEKIIKLPEQCNNFINLTGNKGEVFNTVSNQKSIPVTIDNITKINIYDIAKKLSNIPLYEKNDTVGKMPDKLGFLEMYDVGKVESLNSREKWRNNNPIISLQAPVGYGKSGEIIDIDLHEKFHGPHGIIAGMTGSGKSEFIITYILSLAVNYHPYEVQFILIDYKGGGLAGAFYNQATKIKLPHLVGTITNLDATEINRSLASVESELKNRQRLFNIAREKSGESTVDIYKYQRMYREKVVDIPVAHLFIICDEFAELKTQQPEFMQQLISTARIGRSLGVHLILATQKPSGVVDGQIWSNTRFRVCLRVQEKEDSKEVIKCPDAAFLKKTGRFYFQVGLNEIFILGQAAWAGQKYYPFEKTKKKFDTTINYIDNIGYVKKNIETTKTIEKSPAQGEELNNIVKYLATLANEDSILCRQMWKDRIPNEIFVNDLINKYKYKKKSFYINPVIGEYDVPEAQDQYLLTIPFSSDGNVLVYGSTGSGKENLITTVLYSSMLYYSVQEVNYYIIDFGSGALKMLKDSPLLGSILDMDCFEEITNLFKYIYSTIEKRKEIFSGYNGDYQTYINTPSVRPIPSIIIIINNYEAFQETYSQFEEDISKISRDCIKYGIYFMLACSTPNGLRFKIRQNFNQTYVLQQNNDDDYSTILGNINKRFPSKVFGRGIFRTNGIHEFQTAFVTNRDKISDTIKNLSNKLFLTNKIKAYRIPTLPKVMNYEAIINEVNISRSLVLGMEKETLDFYKYDLFKRNVNVVSGLDLSIINNLSVALLNEIIYLKQFDVIVLDPEKTINREKIVDKSNCQYYDSDFDNSFEKIGQYILKLIENEKNNLRNRRLVCMIIGYENLKNKLSTKNQQKISILFESSKKLRTFSFLVFDSIYGIKKLDGESWFKSISNLNEAIWVGNGINEQITIKVSTRVKEVVEDNFCLVVNNGKTKMVKYVIDFVPSSNSDKNI